MKNQIISDYPTSSFQKLYLFHESLPWVEFFWVRPKSFYAIAELLVVQFKHIGIVIVEQWFFRRAVNAEGNVQDGAGTSRELKIEGESDWLLPFAGADQEVRGPRVSLSNHRSLVVYARAKINAEVIELSIGVRTESFQAFAAWIFLRQSVFSCVYQTGL